MGHPLCLAALVLTATAAVAVAQPPPPIPAAATQPASRPALKPLPPEVVAMFGGPSIEEQELMALQKTLGSTPEEWKVIKPLLQNLMAATRALQADDDTPANPWAASDWANGTFTGPGQTAAGDRPHWAFPTAATQPATRPTAAAPEEAARLADGATLTQSLADLKKLLDDRTAGDAALHRQLEAVRDARHRAQVQRDAAQAELLPLLTDRQEALLVAQGYLEE